MLRRGSLFRMFDLIVHIRRDSLIFFFQMEKTREVRNFELKQEQSEFQNKKKKNFQKKTPRNIY